MCVEPFIITTYQKEKPVKLVKACFESEHNISVCVIHVCVKSKKEYSGSRDFLWTRSSVA